MALCSLQVDSSSAFAGTSVTELPLRNLLSLNQQTYDRLKVALSLNLRRQIFIAVCDDLPLRDRLAMQLQTELAHFSMATAATTDFHTFNPVEPRAIPKLVTLDLNLHDPNPIAQVVEWLSHFPPQKSGRTLVTPAFQFLGIERLTRQSAAIQSIFLSYLQSIEQFSSVDSCLLLWMTQPWFRMLPEAVPEFWHCRTGVFEFIGDPTPLPVTSPERIQPHTPETSVTLNPRNSPTISPKSPNYPDPLADSSSTIGLSENPWIPLAEDLNHWYEPEAEDFTGRAATALTYPSGETATEQLPELENGQGRQAIYGDSPFEPRGATVSHLEPESDLSDLELKLSQIAVLNSEEQSLLSAAQRANQAADSSLLDQPLDLERASIEELLSLNPDFWAQQVSDIQQTMPLLQHIELLQQQIEKLHQGQESTAVLATAYRTLGNFYRDCVEQGDASVENLTFGVQAYEQALQWLPEDSFEQAEVLNDLGNLYWMTAQLQPTSKETVECLQRTVQIYQLALQSLDAQQQIQHVQLYTTVQNNLGATYADLARHQEPAANLQRSIDAYQQVLQYRTAASDALRYASIQNNLGTTYWNLAQHQHPATNLKHAIVAYSEAIQHYEPAQDPLNYAMIQNNLGTAYWNLAQYEQPQDYLTLALTAYQAALQYRTLEAAPVAFAATQNNLGTAYWHLSNHSRQPEQRLSYLQQAIVAYETTLQAAAHLAAHQPDATLNFDLASTQNNLGLAHFQIATEREAALPATTQAMHLEAALQHHLLSWRGWETKPELRQTALSCIVQTVRACYQQLGLTGQNQALSQIPSQLLPEILPKL